MNICHNLLPRTKSQIVPVFQGKRWYKCMTQWGCLKVCLQQGASEFYLKVLIQLKTDFTANRISVEVLQFSSVTQSCPTLWDPMNRSTPGLPVHPQLPEFTQTHVHQVSDAIQPSHPLSSPSPPAPNPSQHQSLFQRVNSSHEVAKVLEFQL